MKFLLDTNTCIYALKQNPAVLNRLFAQSRHDVAVSVLTEATGRVVQDELWIYNYYCISGEPNASLEMG